MNKATALFILNIKEIVKVFNLNWRILFMFFRFGISFSKKFGGNTFHNLIA